MECAHADAANLSYLPIFCGLFAGRVSPSLLHGRTMADMQAPDILHFWFEELTTQQHFLKDPALDADMRVRFGLVLEAASRCELFAWRSSAQGRLAEILVLDQFSRNIHRDTPRAFSQDPLALLLAQEMVAGGHDQALSPAQRAFAYMPYMHSESPVIHQQAAQLFAQAGLENNLNFELRHQAIIARFGRYPHRNATLGRSSTEAELAFLTEPGSGF
jgi:uncharacterized protein (DUF924 family)